MNSGQLPYAKVPSKYGIAIGIIINLFFSILAVIFWCITFNNFDLWVFLEALMDSVMALWLAYLTYAMIKKRKEKTNQPDSSGMPPTEI